TAEDAERVKGAADPVFRYSAAGFIDGDTQAIISGNPVYTTNALSSSPAGTYTITPALGSLSSIGYGFVFADGELTIHPAPQTTPVIPPSVGNIIAGGGAGSGSGSSGAPAAGKPDPQEKKNAVIDKAAPLS